MNFGFKESIDIDLFNSIADIKIKYSKGIVTVIVEHPISDILRNAFEEKGFKVIENKVDLISDRLIQYKFEWD